MALRVRK